MVPAEPEHRKLKGVPKWMLRHMVGDRADVLAAYGDQGRGGLEAVA
jgi:hypothetical protein